MTPGGTGLSPTYLVYEVPLPASMFWAVGLVLAGIGLWSAMTGRIDWPKLWVYFVSGVIVGAGPAAVIWFMELVAQK